MNANFELRDGMEVPVVAGVAFENHWSQYRYPVFVRWYDRYGVIYLASTYPSKRLIVELASEALHLKVESYESCERWLNKRFGTARAWSILDAVTPFAYGIRERHKWFVVRDIIKEIRRSRSSRLTCAACGSRKSYEWKIRGQKDYCSEGCLDAAIVASIRDHSGKQSDVTTGLVYFIEALGADRIKIGYSVNPKARLKNLQTGSAFELSLVGTVEQQEWPEGSLHQRFAAHRIQGEWFHFAADIRAFIAEHAKKPRHKKPALAHFPGGAK